MAVLIVDLVIYLVLFETSVKIYHFHDMLSANSVVITFVLVYSTIARTIPTIKSQPLALLFRLDSSPMHSDVVQQLHCLVQSTTSALRLNPLLRAPTT